MVVRGGSRVGPTSLRAEAVLAFPFTYATEAPQPARGSTLARFVSAANTLVGVAVGAPLDQWQPGDSARNGDMEFEELMLKRVVSSLNLAHADDPAVAGRFDGSMYLFPVQCADANGTRFSIASLEVELYSKDVGLVLITVQMDAAVPVNSVIEAVNALRRLTVSDNLSLLSNQPRSSLRKTPSFLGSPRASTPGPASAMAFSSADVVSAALNSTLGPGTWVPSGGADRLFTYTTVVGAVAEPSTNTFALRTKLAYHLATVTRLHTRVDDAFINSFTEAHGYSRFYTVSAGGSHIVFSHNGGAALVMAGPSVAAPPLVRKGWLGTQRYTKALIKPLLYQRTYLETLGDGVASLMLRGKKANCLDELATIHGAVLEFKARYGQKSIFKPRSMKELFGIWSATVGLDELKQSLAESIGDLHAYYSDVSSRDTQQRLDVLAVVLGMLTLAELVINVYFMDSDWWVPLVVVAAFGALGGLIVVLYVFQRS